VAVVQEERADPAGGTVLNASGYVTARRRATISSKVTGRVVDVLVEEGRGGGGLICIDWKGRLGWAHSTPLMPVGFMAPGHDTAALTF